MKKFIKNFPHILGGHCGSSAFRDLLKFYGHNLSEDMVFGLGSGIDFQYVLMPSINPPLYLGGRTGPLEWNLAERLNIDLGFVSGQSSEQSWQAIKEMINQGIPALVLADVYYLDYLRAKVHMTLHRILIIGYGDEEEVAYVIDNDREEVQRCSYESLSKARSSKSFPRPTENAYFRLKFPEELPNLKTEIPKAIKIAVKNMMYPKPWTDFFEATPGIEYGLGVEGVKKFSQDMELWNKKIETDKLLAGMKSIYVFVEKGGTGFGGFFRRIYGRFLKEASGIMKEKKLEEIGDEYIKIGNRWSDLSILLKEGNENNIEEILNKSKIAAQEVAEREEEAVRELEQLV